MSEFQFYSKLEQTVLLGRKARNIDELLEELQTVSKSSIYYHTHRFLQQHHYLSPEPPNDFAYWVKEVVNDVVLGEKLSSIDIIQYHSITDVRSALMSVIEAYRQSAEKVVDCPPGQEFHFMACQTFVFKIPYSAGTLSEFKEMLNRVSVNSLYFHMFDARLRLEQDENDFSRWFNGQGYKQLAEDVSRLDPYTHTLEGLRKKIIALVNKYDRH